MKLKQHSAVTMTNLGYADDISLFFDNMEKASEQSGVRLCKGFRLNAKKNQVCHL